MEKLLNIFKEIKANNNIYLFIEVPDDAKNFEFIINDLPDDIPYSVVKIFHNKGLSCIEIQESENIEDIIKYEIISTTKDITEEQAYCLFQ